MGVNRPPRRAYSRSACRNCAENGPHWPSGKLNSVPTRELAVVFGQVFADGNRWLLLDLAEVDYISSAGFKTLVSAWQRARAAKGDLVIRYAHWARSGSPGDDRVKPRLHHRQLPEHALARLKK